MQIENNLLSLSKIVFQNRDKWKYVTDKMKIDHFFIFNRYLSKKYPEFSQLLNQKNIDKVVGMDLIFHFMKGKSYPNWFWSKSQKSKEKSIYSDKEIEMLIFKLDIKREELEQLIKFYPDMIKEEIKYYKDIEKSSK